MDQNKIDTLIRAGWRVLNTDFSEKAFNEWRKEALECVVALCGESHPYKEYFQNNIQKDLATGCLEESDCRLRHNQEETARNS